MVSHKVNPAAALKAMAQEGGTLGEDKGGKLQEKQETLQEKVREWLLTARSRLSESDYASYRAALHSLKADVSAIAQRSEAAQHQQGQHFSSEAPLPERIACRLEELRQVFSRADFAGDAAAHRSWLMEFAQCLPVQHRVTWLNDSSAWPLSPVRASCAAAEDAAGDGTTSAQELRSIAKRSFASDLQTCEKRPRLRDAAQQTEDAPSGNQLICVICRNSIVKSPKLSLCGHFACGDCWCRWLALKFECPVCRKKVRPSNLILIRGLEAT
eukprot:TRINITY_DN4783_c0_g1_i1.p1 TRINITY_DN4783_c0_g1~~TRINITY_DN4783_c0_g1_i1.p1  ORF type:complete len:270 (-),score=58.39 TRINITY_DN4783_c0_g1_i1:780-1589(-)